MVLYEASTGADRLEYPDLPADLDAMAERECFLKVNSIILKACEQDVRKRYHTATELTDDLASLVIAKPLEKPGRKLLHEPITAVAATLLVMLSLGFMLYLVRQPSRAVPPEKSIALLPFENLSRDVDDSYFAEGIEEEILTRLAKVGDL